MSHFVVIEWNGQGYDDSEEGVVGVFDNLHHAIEFIHNSMPVLRYNVPLPKQETHVIQEWSGSQNIQNYNHDGTKV